MRPASTYCLPILKSVGAFAPAVHLLFAICSAKHHAQDEMKLPLAPCPPPILSRVSSICTNLSVEHVQHYICATSHSTVTLELSFFQAGALLLSVYACASQVTGSITGRGGGVHIVHEATV